MIVIGPGLDKMDWIRPGGCEAMESRGFLTYSYELFSQDGMDNCTNLPFP